MASGMCVHPYNGARQEGGKLCIYPECEGSRLRIDFMKQGNNEFTSVM